MTSPHQQKLRINGPSIITANRLQDGAVVHRMADGHWTALLEQAEVLTTPEAALAALQAAQSDGLRAAGPYVAPVLTGADGLQPANLRESIRKSGPTFKLPVDKALAQIVDLGSEPATLSAMQEMRAR
jgi:hypothetical protein